MSVKLTSSQAIHALLRQDAGGWAQASFDGPSADEVISFLETASRLPPGQLKRLVSAIREALAEEARLNKH